jgi:hypothetical protein
MDEQKSKVPPIVFTVTRHQSQTEQGVLVAHVFHNKQSGMLHAIAQNGEVVIGVDPEKPIRRIFNTQENAVAWIKFFLNNRELSLFEHQDAPDSTARIVKPGLRRGGLHH